MRAEERERLDVHLAKCPECRERLTEYEAVVAGAIPRLASGSSLLMDGVDDPAQWTSEEMAAAEGRLFARLKEDEQREGRVRPEHDRSGKTAGDTLWRHLWWQFAAGVLLSGALGVALYRTGVRHGSESAKVAAPVTQPVQQPLQVKSSQPAIAPVPVGPVHSNEDAQVIALREQLTARTADVARLQSERNQLTQQLSEAAKDRSQLSQTNAAQQAAANQQLQQTQSQLSTVQKKLDAAASVNLGDSGRLAQLEAKVNDLTASLHGRDEELTREQQILDHDRDIRDLMGSRDLYIAEVYDVAKTGDTAKPFGRVFYTKAKSLIFYAYDLDQQPGVKDTSTFQVWGRKGPDRDTAVRLGILYQDNASKKRWMMKSNDAKTLSGIDAVFVTVEPKGRSQHPSGKPLLFAYLKIEPNHP
ncbi:zf-HC2 domain-containing protein [Edaphobacter acidisoli]|uniref:zf-HC2 domain-containing protein n=1 Tax=Edaphobacter acidisoli TaxID=2040573 RepID=UPI00166C8D2E|nr:zf-HC2 domain-containing protein [Edaphobacter acidisoli]